MPEHPTRGALLISGASTGIGQACAEHLANLDIELGELTSADEALQARLATARQALAAIGDRRDAVLVAQSLGAFTAALVCTLVPVAMLVYINAMIPLPGESPGAWWTNTGWEDAVREDLERYGQPGEWGPAELSAMFMNDASTELAQEAGRHARAQAGTPFGDRLPQEGWSEVVTHCVIARQDRFLPAPFQRRLARERLQSDPDEIDGGHVAIRTNPDAVVALLEGYVADRDRHR